MTKEGLKRAILREFDSLGECAAALGMSRSQLSRSLKTQNAKFLAKLEEVGVKIEEPQATLQEESAKPNQTTIVEELKNIIYEKNTLIEDQRKIIAQKDLIISQYEELNRARNK